MGYGLIGVSTAGDQKQPSPSIWGDCPNTLLEDKGLGYFAHEEFLGNLDISSFADASIFGSGKLDVDADTGTLAPLTGTTGGVAKFTTGGTDNNAVAITGQPLGAIVHNSGNKLWFETNLQLASLFDGAIAIGLTTEANATRDVVADDPSNAAVAALTAASFIGFVSVQAASAIASFNAKYAKGTAAPVTVATDVTNNDAITNQGGTKAALAATTDVKFGIYFNGRDTLTFYVNGYKVGTQEVDATIDQSSNLVPVINIKTGSGAAKAISIDWVRYGFQSRN